MMFYVPTQRCTKITLQSKEQSLFYLFQDKIATDNAIFPSSSPTHQPSSQTKSQQEPTKLIFLSSRASKQPTLSDTFINIMITLPRLSLLLLIKMSPIFKGYVSHVGYSTNDCLRYGPNSCMLVLLSIHITFESTYCSLYLIQKIL